MNSQVHVNQEMATMDTIHYRTDNETYALSSFYIAVDDAAMSVDKASRVHFHTQPRRHEEHPKQNQQMKGRREFFSEHSKQGFCACFA